MTVASAPQLRRVGRFLAGASIAVILTATVTPQAGQPETNPLCIICGSFGGVDAVLNLLLFLPLGLGLALSGVRTIYALFAMLLLSASIEVTQFLFISGRDANIGDVLTNTLGGALGFALASTSTVWRDPSRRAAAVLCVTWSAIWLAVQLISSFAFAPALPASRYYGQIARIFGNMATFGGQVLSATIDTIDVPNFGYAKSEQFRELLRRGAPVSATVIPAAPTSRIAPIVRVADEEGQEIVLLGQDHSDLVFGLRTGAATLRLRPPFFAVRQAFPSRSDRARPQISDTLHLRARYAASGVEMRVDSKGATRQRNMAVYPALGWILVLPMRWYVEGTRSEIMFSLIWLCAWTLPLGYWAACFVASGENDPDRQSIFDRNALMALVIQLALLGVGLVVVPHAFG
ncbi:MAG TPA: VanZ family protein, partial [Gemmatimonadaceae bacterium]